MWVFLISFGCCSMAVLFPEPCLFLKFVEVQFVCYSVFILIRSLQRCESRLQFSTLDVSPFFKNSTTSKLHHFSDIIICVRSSDGYLVHVSAFRKIYSSHLEISILHGLKVDLISSKERDFFTNHLYPLFDLWLVQIFRRIIHIFSSFFYCFCLQLYIVIIIQ